MDPSETHNLHNASIHPSVFSLFFCYFFSLELAPIFFFFLSGSRVRTTYKKIRKKPIFSIQKRYIETSPGRSISLLARVLRLLWVVIVVVLLLSQIDETMGVCYAMGVEGKVFFCDGSDKVTRRSS